MVRKRVLITGAAGFIGQACARQFAARGWHVTALVHHRPLAGLPDAVSLSASITDKEELLAALHGQEPFDALVHCAGRAADVGHKALFRAANYQGVLNVIECVQRLAVGRLVHVSTTDVYGLRDFDNADETTELCNNTGNYYPEFKIQAERAIVRLLPPEKYAILRPAAVWGPGDTSILPRILKYLGQAKSIIHFGRWRGQNRWPLAHVENVARAAFLAATCDEGGGQPYNVIDPERTTIDEYYRLLIDAFLPERRGVKSVAWPLWVGKLIGRSSSLLSTLLGRDYPIFEPSLYGLYSGSFNLDFSGEKLARLFAQHGERFVTRQEGIDMLKTAAPDR